MSTRLSPSEDRVVFPAVPTSVTVGADIPSWTYDSLRRFHRRTRSWLILDFATACFSLGSRELGSCSTSSRRRAPASFRMPSPSVPGLTSSFRVLPETRRRAFGRVCRDLLSARPLSWGFAPFSGHQHKGSGLLSGDFHIPSRCVLRVLTPLDALIPFVPSRHLCRGRSWDCSLQGFTPPADPDSLSRIPSPPGIA